MGVHQCQAGTSNEVREGAARLQEHVEIAAAGQGQAHPHLEQLPAVAEIRDRVLRDACEDLGSPLPGNNITLGTACGKMYRTSVLSITEVGDSDILRSIPESAA